MFLSGFLVSSDRLSSGNRENRLAFQVSDNLDSSAHHIHLIHKRILSSGTM